MQKHKEWKKQKIQENIKYYRISYLCVLDKSPTLNGIFGKLDPY